MTIGRKIIHLEVVDSTNNYTANLLKEGQLEHGTVILADNQFAGRGQRSAEWVVNPGENLTFSVFLDNVNLSVDRQFVLTQIVSISLTRLLSNFGIEAKVKWPNDIYCGTKKIAGVLIENQLQGMFVKSTIIGIGLNINQEQFDGFSATSTKMESGVQRFPKEVVFGFVDVFNACWSEFFGRESHLNEIYHQSLFQRNVLAEYEDANGQFEAEILRVQDDGRLVLMRNDEEQAYSLKELKFIL
ncbi:MAG: biotin--[acetyl-CoA-carboxylase] ligase [Crocinitomicaceae bacterium]|nr:biotin--[acetyl-CoA-carboxylase] ligase [Crocinitomicaceae bacterium]